MQFEQPNFPLSISAFAAALRTGHGRAIQQVSDYGVSGLEASIIEACLSCPTYDPQCEAERAPWLFSIVERAGLNRMVLEAIEASASVLASKDLWDMEHRSSILKELASAGSEEARRLLYSSLARWPQTSDVVGADQIVALDGAEGLKHVARQHGCWLRADPDFWVDDRLIAEFDAATGHETGLSVLEREANADPDIASYLEGLRKATENQSAPSSRFDATTYTGADIVAYVENHPNSLCWWFMRWGRQAPIEQREVVFAALLASDDPKKVERLCRCFSKVGIPYFDERLLRWIVDADEEVRQAAARAVASVPHAQVREVALRQVSEGDMATGITLLVNNFEAGDFALCANHLKTIDDADQAHHFVGSLMDLCVAHPGADALNCLLYVYEFSPCSTCRNRAVSAMVSSRTAPAWVLAEAAQDADPDTRALVVTEHAMP